VNLLNLELYLKDIAGFKELIVELPEDNAAPLLKKIELLSKCLVLVGEVSAEFDLMYKLIHVQRDMDYAQAYIEAERPKKENAELATRDIREMEAEAYGRSMKYRNEFVSTRETIHALKMKLNACFADGSIGSRYQGGV
jgi:hypothetical protein